MDLRSKFVILIAGGTAVVLGGFLTFNFGDSDSGGPARYVTTVSAKNGGNVPARTVSRKAQLRRILVRSDPVVGTPVSIDTARSDLSVPLLTPNAPAANDGNQVGVYAIGKGAIELRYPAPDDSSSDLDQPSIVLSESAWAGGDPAAFNKDDIAANPDVGKSLCQVGDLPALCVEPRSPSSAGASNPAFIRVVIGKTGIVLLGGDDLDALMEVAKSLSADSSSNK